MSDKESHVTKSDLTISGGGKSYRQFTLKLPSTIYPKSSVWFTPPPRNRQGRFSPQITKYDLPPLKSSNFEQNFKRTQHHALLHKGLFCERPMTCSDSHEFFSFVIYVNFISVLHQRWNVITKLHIILGDVFAALQQKNIQKYSYNQVNIVINIYNIWIKWTFQWGYLYFEVCHKVKQSGSFHKRETTHISTP